MRIQDTDQVVRLKDRRTALQSQIAGTRKALMDTTLRVQLRGDIPRDKNEIAYYEAIKCGDDGLTTHSSVRIPPNDPRREAIIAIMVGLLQEELELVESQLRDLSVTL